MSNDFSLNTTEENEINFDYSAARRNTIDLLGDEYNSFTQNRMSCSPSNYNNRPSFYPESREAIFNKRPTDDKGDLLNNSIQQNFNSE